MDRQLLVPPVARSVCKPDTCQGLDCYITIMSNYHIQLQSRYGAPRAVKRSIGGGSLASAAISGTSDGMMSFKTVWFMPYTLSRQSGGGTIIAICGGVPDFGPRVRATLISER